MDHKHNPEFPVSLRRQYSDLQTQLLARTPREPLKAEIDGFQFLCVWNGLQNRLDRYELRKQIGNMLGLTDMRLIQLVGDSNSAFSMGGIEKVEDILSTLLDEVLPGGRCAVLEYGYTAIKHDTNWILNEIIAARPELGRRTIASVVAMSSLAVDEWGAEATGLVKNFVLAYDEVETTFGSDSWLSDEIMIPSHNDKLICVEGGPQSFAQAVSVCSRGVQVLAITGPGLREISSSSAPTRFSAAYLLAMLRDTWCMRFLHDDQGSSGRIDLESVASRYLNTCFKLSNNSDLRKHETIVAALEIILQDMDMIQAIEVLHI